MIHAATLNATRPASRPAGRGFTLVELMIVLFILGVLVTLVVSVGRYVLNESSKQKTAAALKLLNSALLEYHEQKGAYPDDTDPNGKTPSFDGDDEKALRNAAIYSSKGMVHELMEVKASKAFLDDLPADMINRAEGYVKDGWDRPMAYLPDGGMANRPVVISAGPDGEYGRDLQSADNIRSDEIQ